MENIQSPYKDKVISIQEEKLIREVNYDSLAEKSSRPKKLFLEIVQKSSDVKDSGQKVLVSIKPRTPAIKILYRAEKSRFHSKKRSERSGLRLAIGDHSSFTTHFSEDVSNTSNSVSCGTIHVLKDRVRSEIIGERISTSTLPVGTSTEVSQCSNTENSFQVSIINTKKTATEKCYLYSEPQITMTLPEVTKITQNSKATPKKVDIGTLIVTEIPSDEKTSPHNISHMNKRIEQLERKFLKQEMVFRSLNPDLPFSSSDEEEYKENKMRASSSHGRAGCSYIEYSHIPETSAFQRYSQQPAPLSASKATTIQKEHNSEQYGRDFTLYDGITARGKRQCASVPCKRDDGSKMAAERVHKIRHKLNPVRDYRLMDTVHYLAQGEFAPRDDGIKLTPSREAVLSDIIYEDVCRTHWPNARLARRLRHPDRYGTRSDLQELIDSLLQERVAHVERRKRRHYRIVKLNHRHENSCRSVGKTGDIIVANHKNRRRNEDIAASDHNTANAAIADNRRNVRSFFKNRQSYERLVLPESRPGRRLRQENCSPGPSYAAPRSTTARAPTCCYRTSSRSKPIQIIKPEQTNQDTSTQDLTSSSTIKTYPKNPRLVVKKNSSRKKYKEELNLEHYILLPSLVVKTPSNMRRQKKFSELYHRILNLQLNKANPCVKEKLEDESTVDSTKNKKNIGLNINVTVSSSEEALNKK
ncbi:uncharacterized protein LOC123872337 [Maniola jurtina]|uniref:uncharacterized protein LOC123872337 n=1 Tax=Maniola jurtina TaxID=191418 RepID=UPI001E68B2E9|nr:uncharacterized protein LOC123872337 [Maniola jurtina]